MRNILLIGGSGFIGSSLVKQLIIGGYNISILELPSAKNFIATEILQKVKIHYGEINQCYLIKNITVQDSIDTVIHLVSTLIPSSTLDDYINEFDNIIKPTIKLLPFFAASNIKFIFFSSGGTIYGVNENGYFSESDKTNPISYYGQSKLIIEESILLEHRKSNLNYLILRPSNPYGIGQNIFGKQGLIAASIGHVLNNEKITIWGDGSVVRDYIQIDDLAKSVTEIIKRRVNNEIFNLGSGQGYSINEIISTLRKCVNVNFEVEYIEARSVDVPVLILNVDKFNQIATVSKTLIEDGISDFYNYELLKKKKK